MAKIKRLMVGIPEGCEAYEYLIRNENTVHWKTIGELVKRLPKSKEDRAIELFEDFIEKMVEIFPEKKTKIELLRPLILKRIIGGAKLEDYYYEELKKI